MSVAPSLNVYKKIAVIRFPSDNLFYEDAEGNQKSVSVQELGDAIATATPLHTPRAKLDIPVPRIKSVETYERDVPPNYNLPRTYVRWHRVTPEEWHKNLDYVADQEDETWLEKNSNFCKPVSTKDPKDCPSTAVVAVRPASLNLQMFEHMMDLLEKATAFDAIITSGEAEHLILTKIPQLYHIFPAKARQGAITTRHVINDVYTYWVQKRSKLKRPLLRRFWPVTSSDDTNPHLVFRPREKEKYKLRKKRQNDASSCRKMKQLREDFENLRSVLELVRRREDINRLHIQATVELFQQRLYDIVDTSGLPRVSKTLRKDKVRKVLDVPNHFEVQPGGRRIIRIRHVTTTPMNVDVQSAAPSSMESSTDIQADAASTTANIGSASATGATSSPPASASGQPAQQQVLHVAGRNHGEPAPNFLHPLESRETYATSWENAVPHIASYENANPLPTYRFRHRPRVGRGGRILIDRLPQIPPSSDNPLLAPRTVYNAGMPLPHSVETKARLLDLLPRPLDRNALSRKIEAISIASIKEDFEAKARSGVASGGGGEPDENDGEEVIVQLEEYLETDDQLWGDERYALGPI